MKKSVIASIIFLTLSCTTESYQYRAGLEHYLKNELNIKLDTIQNQIWYITPLNGCDYCVIENLRNIDQIYFKETTVLFIGKPKSNEIKQLANQVQGRFGGKQLFDQNEKINKYNIEFSKPLLLHFSNGKIKHHMIIEDDLIDSARFYINRIRLK